MRALTLKRKWAERIFDGRKRYEVRRFRTDYRGDVVITISGEKIAYGIVSIMRIVPSEEVAELTAAERAYGQWAWELFDPQRCEPVACRGRLGLWMWTLPTPKLLEVA